MKNENKLISIIVPLYNCKTITKCLDSIMAQTYEDIEVIIVDDGSNIDIKGLINYYLEDNRFKYFYKKNGGVSSARNEGIRQAKGEYITFLDADDSIQKDVLYEAVSFMGENDIVLWGSSRVYNEVIVHSDHLTAGDGEISIENLSSNVLYTQECTKYGTHVRACWAKLFKADIINRNHLMFDEAIYMGEDALFVLEYLRYARSAWLLDINGYYYNMGENSATSRYKADLRKQCNLQIQYIEKHFLTKSDNQYLVAFSDFKWWMFNMLLDNSAMGIKKKKIHIYTFVNDAKAFYKENLHLMIERPIAGDKILPEFRNQYLYASKRNSWLMIFFWGTEKIKRKMGI